MQLQKSGDCRGKSSPPFEVRFGTIKGNVMLLNIIEIDYVSWTNFQDKLQFVNLLKRLVFDLTKIPYLKCLISIYHLIVEVLNDQNLFTESNWGDWCSSYVQFYSGGHFPERTARQSGKVSHLNHPI